MQRSLAPHSENARYYIFEVQKSFEMNSGQIASWFDQPGEGTQYIKYRTDGDIYEIRELIRRRLIKIVQHKK